MRILIALSIVASSLFISCSSSSNNPPHPAQAPTGAEASLFNEINKIRSAAGKKPLTRSSKLDAIAASESSRLAKSGSRNPNVSALRSRAGYNSASIIVGSLKDRGPATGASYPSYWMKSEREKGYLLDSWYRIGVGTAKSTTGELVSVVILGKFGGSALMNPM